MALYLQYYKLAGVTQLADEQKGSKFDSGRGQDIILDNAFIQIMVRMGLLTGSLIEHCTPSHLNTGHGLDSF